MIFDQAEFEVRCEWGEAGVTLLAPISDAIIIVDVMSFSTDVVIAAARGASVFPWRFRDDSAVEFARSMNAELAGPRGEARYSLSPASLMTIPPGTRLVLPSPNGSTLSLSAGETPTLAGCLRNSQAVAKAASSHGSKIAVIPCGERWASDHSLRPAIEDLIGAGAIIRCLGGSLSPESQTAVTAFRDSEADISSRLRQCVSGRELIAKGFEQDVVLAAQVDVDDCAPVLRDGAYLAGA